tara:strand:- start:167 stop:430 length:264 start_codon:yes stop_codon:yes gene_type:complete
MYNKIKNIIYLSSFIGFFVLIIIFYFSESNILKTNKLRSTYIYNSLENNKNLPILKNDTINVFEYKNDIEIFINERKKYKFWDLIKK